MPRCATAHLPRFACLFPPAVHSVWQTSRGVRAESTQPARGCLETSRIYLQGTGCLADCERDLFQQEQRTLEFCSKGLLSDCAAKSAPCLNTEPAPPSSTSSGGSASSSETAGDGATPSSGGSTVQGLTSSPPATDSAVSLTAWGAVATAAAWAVLLAA